MKRLIFLISLILTIMMLSACGGGGDDGDDNGNSGNTESTLKGTWYGVLEDWDNWNTLTVTFNASGDITQILIDGNDQGITATTYLEQGNIYGMEFSDGGFGGFIVNNAKTHAAFLTEEDDFGIVQKGASSLPTFNTGDARGSWTGHGVTIDANYDLVDVFTSTANVDNSDTISGSDSLGSSFGGAIENFSPSYGIYWGDYIESDTAYGVFEIFLSADKQFAATWACDTSDGGIFTWPVDCKYTFWDKQ